MELCLKLCERPKREMLWSRLPALIITALLFAMVGGCALKAERIRSGGHQEGMLTEKAETISGSAACAVKTAGILPIGEAAGITGVLPIGETAGIAGVLPIGETAGIAGVLPIGETAGIAEVPSAGEAAEITEAPPIGETAGITEILPNGTESDMSGGATAVPPTEYVPAPPIGGTDVPSNGAEDITTGGVTDVPSNGITDIPSDEESDVPSNGVTDIPSDKGTDAPSDETGTDGSAEGEGESSESGNPPVTASPFLIDEAGMIYGFQPEYADITDGALSLPSEGCVGIRSGVFSGSGAGIYELHIPANIAIIEEGAFGGLYMLEWVEADAGNTAFVSVEGVLFDSSMTGLYAFPAGRTGAYKVPGTVTYIANGAFAGTALSEIDVRDCPGIDTSSLAGCGAELIFPEAE